MRTSAGWSEVATTTTECSSASPRSRSMNSRTSRPRSPTSAMTLTEALVERAIMPSSEDLPTPEPAKMPRRWPRPQGTRPSSARTPSATRSLMRGRSSAPGGRRSVERAPARRWCLATVERGAQAVDHAPEQTFADGHAKGRAGRQHLRAGADPVQLAERHQQRAPFAEADDLGGNGARDPSPSVEPLVALLTRQTSPTSACRPVASMIRPIRLLTRPCARARSALRSAARGALEQLAAQRARAHAAPRSRARRGRPRGPAPAGSATLASTSLSTVRTIAPPRPTRRSAWISQCSMPPARAVARRCAG